jgi:hypothetical protein
MGVYYGATSSSSRAPVRQERVAPRVGATGTEATEGPLDDLAVVTDAVGSLLELQQLPVGQLQAIFVRRERGPDRVVDIRAALLDVGAEHVGDDAGLGEGDEPVDACGEGGVVGHVDVDAAWVHGVAGEEQTGLPVVDRDRRLVMAGGVATTSSTRLPKS